MTKSKTTEQFVIDAINIHGDKYNYSKVNYIGAKNKIIIICKIHDEFAQKPNHHLTGSGCKLCGFESNICSRKSNSEDFINKAIIVQGNKYDYSKVEYKKAKEKVIIICKEHGEFLQTPSDHLSNHGCKKCGIENNAKNCRSNSDTFIKKSIEIHGDTYDYSKVNYINSKLKVIVICKKHGGFEQLPTDHLQKKGCNKCAMENNGNNRRSNNEEFIKKSTGIHGDKYDYTKVEYKNALEKIIIICKKHGDFEQRPNSHLRGYGCEKCSIENNANNKRYDNDEFIKKAILTHGNKYDYSKLEYKNSQTKIIIICKEHGEFEQSPPQHLSNHGCNKCAIENNAKKQTSNNEEFIRKAKKLYDDKYNYSKVNYVNCRTNVIILCNIHGEFEQRPNDHLSGYSCYKCATIKQYSKCQIIWLNFIQKYYNVYIQHAENNIEFKIDTTNFKADGYCKETNTIYEFHGDYWHGNPKKFNSDDYNKTTKCTFGELYKKTLEREQMIKNLGYNLVIIWENDWRKINKYIKILQQKFRNSKFC